MLTLAVAALIAIGSPQDPEWSPPPEEALATHFVYGQKTVFSRKPWEGVAYEEVVEPRHTDIDAMTMLRLVYRKDEVRGLVCTAEGPNGSHTGITVFNSMARIIRFFHSRETIEVPVPGSISGESGQVLQSRLIIEIRVLSDTKAASLHADSMFKRKYTEGAKLLSDSALGRRHWIRKSGTNSDETCFLDGRAVVWVHYMSYAGVELGFAEALAWGIAYRLALEPQIKAPRARPTSGLRSVAKEAKAVNLSGVRVGPVSAFRQAGVRVSLDRAPKSVRATLTRGERTVRLAAFDWEMDTGSARVRLSRPAVPYRGDLIVPLRAVADALGVNLDSLER